MMKPANQVLDHEISEIVAQIDASRIESDIQTLVGFGTRNTCSDDRGDSTGIGAACDWIKSQFAAIPGLEVQLDPFRTDWCKSIGFRHNVIACHSGDGDSDRLIVIGGHYDSRTTIPSDISSPAPGANDSASQTALVLEAARAMAGWKFHATIVFATWAGEEQGLRGSASFVKNYRSYFPSGTLELYLNADIVGGDNTVNDAADLQQFRVYSPGSKRETGPEDGISDDTSPSRSIMRHIGYWGARYVPAMTMIPKLRRDRYNRGSDHISFLNVGVPSVRFIESNENVAHQHSPDDLFDYVTPTYTARVAQVVVACAATLARASTPPREMSAALESEGILKLSWVAPATGPPVDQYVISARVVSENLYRTRFAVPGTVLSTTARVTEDLGIPSGTNYYVSVASVDAAGHESLYAFPELRCDAKRCFDTAGSGDSHRINREV